MTARAQAERRAIEESGRTPPKCPTEFATTDRICLRWAVSVGLGVQSDKWQNEVRSRVPPLDDPTAIVVDQIIMKSPPRTKALIFKWYRTDLPTEAMARELRISPHSVEKAWHLCLLCLQHRFLNSEFPPLLKLLRFKDEVGT